MKMPASLHVLSRCFALVFFICGTGAYAQKKVVLSGMVKDAATGEILIGAAIRVEEIPGSLSLTNAYGFYSLNIPKGEYRITTSYIGYEPVSKQLEITENMWLDMQLKPGQVLEEVTITAAKGGKQLADPQMGVEKLNVSEVSNMPVLLGEKDILKTLQLLPGIKSAGEGNSGFYIRGGSVDQNLLLLDEAPVYNASHLLGFFSTFNSDAIKDVAVYKGDMPAQYGGRLASVVDIKMNDGNKKDYEVSGGLGLIASRLKLEGPLHGNKGSFMLSGRRTYADLFLRLSPDTTINSTSLYFYDFNAKANYEINPRNTVYFSAYLGKDVLGLQEVFNMDWGNTTASLRWNHLFSGKLFSNASLIYSDYKYAIRNFDNKSDFKIKSGIRDLNLKYDFQYFANEHHTLRYGLQAVYHTITPGIISASEKSSVNDKALESRYGTSFSLYLSDELKSGKQFNLRYGLRLSSFLVLGPGEFNTYNKEGAVTASEEFSAGKIAKVYVNLEPRIAASWQLNGKSAVKAGYARNTQNLHLLSNSSSTLPTDLWVMNSLNIKPEIADQVSAGYYHELKNGEYEFSAELYYKAMQNQIDYKNAADLQTNENVESELLYGKGRAYGLELFLRKRLGNLTGWVAYTLSRSERSFAEINNGDFFPAKQDRTHEASFAAVYTVNKRVRLSASFVYNTGNAVTFPSGKYTIDSRTAFYYTERNGYRMPEYHRLDLGATFDGRYHSRFHSSWTLGIYNVYNRKNAYTVDFREAPDNPSQTQAVKTSLFGIIPAVTWNFKF